MPTSTMTLQAYLYARWSTQEQSKGSSLPRQHDITSAFAKSRGWAVADKLKDEGVSAWTGANLTIGNLASFIDGLGSEGGHGKVLVVEQLDRITRRPPMEVLLWIHRVTATGLTIVTVNDGLVINADTILRENVTIMTLLLRSFTGFGESDTKSVRVGDAWDRKRKTCKPMTARAPAWIKTVQRNGERHYELHADRADIVRRIFRECLDGRGKVAIASGLNRDKVPTFGKSQGWRDSYIAKILANEAVIGRFQPCKKSRTDIRRIPTGEALEGYFPRVIDEATFEAVRTRPRNTSQAAGRKFANLWAGLTRCHDCGGSMNFLNKGLGARAKGPAVFEQYLRCERGLRGLCTSKVTFSYNRLTNTVFDQLLHLAMDDRYFDSGTDVSELANNLAAAERTVIEQKARCQRLLKLVADDDTDDEAAGAYRNAKERRKTLECERDHLKAALRDAKAAVSPAKHLQRVADVRRLIDSTDEAERTSARMTVKAALDDLVDRFEFSGEAEQALLCLKGGVRHLVIGRDGSLLADIPIARRRANSDDATVTADYFRRLAA